MRETRAVPLVLLSSDKRRCAVNGLQIETVEERHNGAEITFASGTTLVVEEPLEEILALFAARGRGDVGRSLRVHQKNTS